MAGRGGESIGDLPAEEDPDVIGGQLLFSDHLLIWEEDEVVYTIGANSDRPPEGIGRGCCGMIPRPGPTWRGRSAGHRGRLCLFVSAGHHPLC